MSNYKMIISYDGTKYDGWQKQGNTTNTIQCKIEEIIGKLIKEKVEVNGSGRTDAGVHALGQVISVETTKYIGPDSFKKDLNKFLPCDIRVISCENADNRFHARLNSKGKHYCYNIDNGDISNIFERRYMARVEEKLDINLMKNAADKLIGEHDFTSFCSNKHLKKSAVRRIDKIDITSDKGIIKIDVYGNGFLYNMVRIIAGVLIEVGKGTKKTEYIDELLDVKKKTEERFIAPAKGLFLMEVMY